MHLSDKQLALLLTVLGKNIDGTLNDLDQLIEKQLYETNKPSIQFIVRNLIARGLIHKVGTEIRNKRRKVLFDATPLGKQLGDWHTGKAKSIKEVIVE